MQEKEIYDSGSESADIITLREIFEICLHKWYWFLISILVCLIGSYFYVKTQPNVYRSEAIIMIKTDTKKGGQLSESAIFSDLGLGNDGNVIENEIYVLRSTTLIEQVIKKLGIDVKYEVKSFLRDNDIYGNYPIIVDFKDIELMRDHQLEVVILSDLNYQYRIVDRLEDRYLTDWAIADFGKELQTIRGRFVINKTPLYTTEDKNSEIRITVSTMKYATKSILENLSINRVDKITGILKFSIDDTNLLRGRHILNTLIDVYNGDVINDKNRVATNTEKFIMERISSLSEDLGSIDGEIEQLKKDNNITDFTASSGILLQKGSKYQEDVIAIETEISLIGFIKEYLSDPTKRKDLIPTNTGISDIGLEAQITKYNEEILRLEKLNENSGKNNPVTIELNKSLSATKANMLRSIDNVMSSLKIKLNQAKAQEGIANRRIESVPTQEKKVNTVIRQQKIKEELYLYLLNKREENALNLAITESNAKIIESADGEPHPVSPKLSIFLLVALILGFAAPFSIIYLLLLFDNKVHGKKDIEKYTQIPVIGMIPSKDKKNKNDEIIITETGRDKISEAFRMVRSNLNFVLPNKTGQANIIQFTSTVPGEGKSYSIVNIALAFAHTNKRVLLIDLDIRKGTISKHAADVKSDVGVSTYLSGKIADVNGIIHKNFLHKNLDFISTGTIPPNPANLLMSENFDKMIRELQSQYDFIFMDTVPALIVADAKIINKSVDATIYVMRDGMIDKRYLVELQKLYSENVFKNMTILVTDIDISTHRYTYGYGYGYGNYGDTGEE